MTILDIFIYSIVKNMTRVLFSRILRALIPYLHFSQFNNVILRKYGIGLIHSHLPFIRLKLSSCYILHNTLQIIFIQLHPGFSSRWIKIRFRFKFQSIVKFHSTLPLIGRYVLYLYLWVIVETLWIQFTVKFIQD